MLIRPRRLWGRFRGLTCLGAFSLVSTLGAACGSRSDLEDLEPWNLGGQGGSGARGGANSAAFAGVGGGQAGALPGAGRGAAPGAGRGGANVGGAPIAGAPGMGGIGGNPGNCCIPHSQPSCTNRGIESCVCNIDPLCCSQGWDQICVNIAEFGCNSCASGGAGGFGTAGTSVGGAFTGGTSAGGSFTAGAPSAGVFGGGTGGGLAGAGGKAGSCCTAHTSPGCSNAGIEACVCSWDPFCCTNFWDQQCVRQVENLGCGRCQSSTAGAGGVAGAMGQGGSGAISGAGGSPGGGGLAAQLCRQPGLDSCSTCLCSGCFRSFAGCLDDLGCILIFECMEQTGCEGIGCYSSPECRGLIDSWGGLMGPSMRRVLSLASCASAANCPCN